MVTSFLPTLAESRIARTVLSVGGIALCMPGIGKASRLGLWLHPVSFAAYALGAVALILLAQGLFRFRLLPVSSLQALLIVLGIIVVKIALAPLLKA